MSFYLELRIKNTANSYSNLYKEKQLTNENDTLSPRKKKKEKVKKRSIPIPISTSSSFLVPQLLSPYPLIFPTISYQNKLIL